MVRTPLISKGRRDRVKINQTLPKIPARTSFCSPVEPSRFSMMNMKKYKNNIRAAILDLKSLEDNNPMLSPMASTRNVNRPFSPQALWSPNRSVNMSITSSILVDFDASQIQRNCFLARQNNIKEQ